MARNPKKPSKKLTTLEDPSYRSQQLADALEAADAAAVAFALRNDKVVVPLLAVPGPPQIRVFRRDDADTYMLLTLKPQAQRRIMLEKLATIENSPVV